MEHIEYDIYLAGPFFNPEQIKTMDRAKEILLTQGYTVFDPREHGVMLKDLTPAQRKAASEKVFIANVHGIMKSHTLFACIDDRDTGTAFEIGVAFTQRMRVYTFSAKDYGCNVMLSQAAKLHFQNMESLELGAFHLASLIRGRVDFESRAWFFQETKIGLQDDRTLNDTKAPVDE